MRFEDTLILGGGPAGSAAAIGLARAGRAPLVIERARETQDVICGGFLSWNTARRLRALGVDPEALGARQVHEVALFAAGREARAPLPHASWSLSRRRLDAALLDEAQACGARIERGIAARAVEDGQVVLAGGERVAFGALVLATGKHDLRGGQRPAVSDDPAIGLRWKLPPGAALARLVAGTVELHLFAGGYAGLALQEDGSGNLCMAMKRSVLAGAGGDPSRLLAVLAQAHPALAMRLDASGGDPGPAQAIANVPYGWIAQGGDGPGYRVGDQAAVIPSLAGEGVAIAIASGAAAARAILSGQEAGPFRKGLAARARVPVGAARAMRSLFESRLGARAALAGVARFPGLAGLAARVSRIGA